MKITIDVQDEKVPFVMDILNDLPFVQTEPLDDETAQTKEEILKDIKESVNYMKLVKQGKAETKNVEELINSL